MEAAFTIVGFTIVCFSVVVSVIQTIKIFKTDNTNKSVKTN